MMIHEEIIDNLKEYFSKREDIEGVMLYGSIIGGVFTDNSDIDLAVDLGRPMGLDEQLDLVSDVNVFTKRDVDLVDLHTARGLIHYNIMTKGLKLKGSDSFWFINMKEALYFQADLLPQLNRMSEIRIERMLNG